MENVIIANWTDTGKVRSVNEDSMATFDSPNGRVVVVCDGMGGQNAGDVASQLAVSVIQDILTDNRFASPQEAITKSITAANQAILVRAAQNPGLSGMGSTCVMVIVDGGKAYYGSVGDSRIYYITGNDICQLTKDQSYVQTLVDAGEITQEAAEHHKDKNQITNALGIEGMTPPVICQVPLTPEAGSVILLCSDGLSGMISNKMIADTVADKSLPLRDRAQKLVNLANQAGGMDNITVQLVEFPAGGAQVYGGKPGKGGKKPANKVAMYWIAAVACLVIAIGILTYCLIPKKETPAAPTKSSIYNEQQKQTAPAEKQQQKNEKTVIYVEKPVPVETPKPNDNTEVGEKKPKSKSKSPKETITGGKTKVDSTLNKINKINEKDFSTEKDETEVTTTDLSEEK